MLSRFRRLIHFLFCILLVIVIAMYIQNRFSTPFPELLPVPEENANPTIEDDGPNLEQPKGGGAVGISYSKHVTISLSDKTASLFFCNSSRSNQSMVLDIVIQDKVIVRSGGLFPGNQVTTLPLMGHIKLSSGHYEGSFQLYFYNTETKDRNSFRTEIPVSIDVS